MEPEDIVNKESFFEQLTNIIKRTPDLIASGDNEGEEFESAEHENIGNKVKLRFPLTPELEISGAEKLLTLPNGLKLTFGQIICLAGDFYGIPKQPIIDASEKDDVEKATGRRKRFAAAYDTLANANFQDIKKELDQILKIMTKERKAVEMALERQEQKVAVSDDDGNVRIVPKDVYDKLGNSLVKKWDTITGGKWIFGVPVIFGRMMKLAENNHDHFLPFAKDAYLTGHELALEKAKEASNVEQHERRMRLLEEAYSIDAFACHFLTDSFSSGHLRTPRLELAKKVTPSRLGHLLCKYMHDEDNTYGLRVTNERGDKWIAYGDGMLLNEESEDNCRIAVEAVQTSVNEVYEAFQNPNKAGSLSLVPKYIPFVDPGERNNYPMFVVQNGKLLRRADLNNLSDHNTKSDWLSMTVVEIQSYKPHSSVIEDYDEDIDCRGCGQSLHPEIQMETVL